MPGACARLARVSDDLEPDFDRYLSALRRRWWVVAGAVVLVTLLFLGSADRGYRRDTQVIFSTTSPALAVSEGEAFDLTSPILVPVGRLGESAADSELSSAVDATVELEVEGKPGSQGPIFAVDMSVTGPTEGAVDVAMELALTRLLREYRDGVSGDVDATITSIERRISNLDERIAALDEQVGGLADRSSPLADGLLVERAKRADERLGFESRIAGLETFLASVDSNIELIEDSEARRTDSILIRGILGIVLGLLLGAGAVLVSAVLRRRVHDRGDVERLAAGPVIATVVNGSGRPRSLVAAAAALAHTAHATVGADRIALVSLGRSGELSQLGNELTEAGTTLGRPLEIVAIDDVLRTSEALSAALTAPLVVLAVRSGRSLERDVVRIVNEFQAAGVTYAGTMLIDASPSTSI